MHLFLAPGIEALRLLAPWARIGLLLPPAAARFRIDPSGAQMLEL